MERLGSSYPENQNPLPQNLPADGLPAGDFQGLDRAVRENNDHVASEPLMEPNTSTLAGANINTAEDIDREELREDVISYGRIGVYALATRAAKRRADSKADSARKLTDRVEAHQRASELAQLPYTLKESPDKNFDQTRKRGETLAQFRIRTGMSQPARVQGHIPSKPNGKKIYKDEILANEVLGTEYKRAGKRLRRQRRGEALREEGVALNQEGKRLKERGDELMSSKSLSKKTRGLAAKTKGMYRSAKGKIRTSKGEIRANIASPQVSRRILETRQQRSIQGVKKNAYLAKRLGQRTRELIAQTRSDEGVNKNRGRDQRQSISASPALNPGNTRGRAYPARPSARARQNTETIVRTAHSQAPKRARTEWGRRYQEQQARNRRGVI